MKKTTTGSSLALFTAAVIWGLAFVSQSKGMDYMHPLTFQGVRCIIGAAALFLYLMVTRSVARRRHPETVKPIDWSLTLQAGLLCGLAFTLAGTLQQYGIKYTTVGKAGFITTLYIIFVPVAGVFLRRKVAAVVWFAATMAAVGMYLLCMTESLKLGVGDILVFLCAVVFAVHIMIVDHYAPKVDGVILSCMQLAVCGILCGIGCLVWGDPTWGQIQDGLGTLLYAGVLSCGVAYTLQIIGQKRMNPTIAALILSLESVVATVAGYAAYRIGFLQTDQTMTGRQIAGCILVFVAVLLVQLPSEWFSKLWHKEGELKTE